MQEKADKIIDLILKSLREEITDEEKKELDKWLAESPAYRQLFEELTNEHFLKNKLKSFRQVDADGWWKKISEQIDLPAESAPMHRIPEGRWRFVVAGIIVLILGLGIYYYFFAKPSSPGIVKNKDKSEQITNIGPGGNKAQLTLANGRVYILDSLENGWVVAQDNTKVTKVRDGELTFENIEIAQNPNSPSNYLTLNTPNAGQYSLMLPDGTMVWLNAASSIRYPGKFTGKERRVEITGEVYFEVEADQVPFIVKILSAENKESGEVRVLGTQFNINAYAEEPSIKTTLLKGKVRITVPLDAGAKTPASRLLTPGEQAIIQPENPTSRIDIVKDIDTGKAIAWKKGIISFDNTPFEAIMRQIGRWYDVNIRFEGNAPGKRLSGDVERADSLLVVLEKLEFVSGIHFKIEGKTVVVLKN